MSMEAFQEAAGFSAQTLSLLIRTLIFLMSVVWGAFIVKGIFTQMLESEDPMAWFFRLVMLVFLLTALWILIY